MYVSKKRILSSLFIFLFSFTAYAQEEPKTLRVAIKPSEPWVMYDNTVPPAQRKPVGFSIDLWKGIAKELGVKTQWVYQDNVPDLLKSVQQGQADVGISAITIRSDREQVVDFSTSMFELGLQIMVKPNANMNAPIKVLIQQVGRFITLPNVLIFLSVLFCIINLRWWVDRLDSSGTKLFTHNNYWHGLSEAFWWSITMLITWEAPKSKGLARMVDLGWHFTGLIAMSVLTGIIAAALTIQAVGGAISSEKDLPGKRVAAVATDAPRDYLENIGARVVPVNNLNEGIDRLLDGEVDALVHDGPRLLYLAEQRNKKEKQVAVLPAVFNHQNYGIVLPNGSDSLESVNLALLKLREPEGLEDSFHTKLKKKWIPKTN
jgi:polar amino acid transport system substrate-binding protein